MSCAQNLFSNGQGVDWNTSWLTFGMKAADRGKFQGKVDMHFHSGYSDGKKEVSIDDICQFAHYYGLAAISLTDHETIVGLREFLRFSREHSVPAITGIEFNALVLNNQKIDVLGYGFDMENTGLQRALDEFHSNMLVREEGMIDWANENLRHYQMRMRRKINFPRLLGVQDVAVSEEERGIIHAKIEQGEELQRTLIADLLLEKDYFPVVAQGLYPNVLAFDFLEGSLSPPMELNKIIELIHSACGLVFMAHSFGNSYSAKEISKILGGKPEDYIKIFLDRYNFDGIEVVHSEHSMEQIDYLMKLAMARKLLLSGGSDTHWRDNRRVFGISPERALPIQEWMKDKII